MAKKTRPVAIVPRPRAPAIPRAPASTTPRPPAARNASADHDLHPAVGEAEAVSVARVGDRLRHLALVDVRGRAPPPRGAGARGRSACSGARARFRRPAASGEEKEEPEESGHGKGLSAGRSSRGTWTGRRRRRSHDRGADERGGSAGGPADSSSPGWTKLLGMTTDGSGPEGRARGTTPRRSSTGPGRGSGPEGEDQGPGMRCPDIGAADGRTPCATISISIWPAW